MGTLFDDKFLSELPALRFTGPASQTAAMAGTRKSNAKGSSVEFSDFREYLPGDDIRRLDWNAYARLGKLYMKLYREERESVISIYVDLSPSMDYGTAAKASQALRLAAVLSWLALKGQDRVRIVLCGLDTERGAGAYGRPVPPLQQTFHGSAAFARVLAYLQDVEDFREACAAAGRGVGTGRLWEALRRYPPALSGITALISDFLPEEVEEEVKYLAGFRKQTVLLLQVLAAEEIEPDFAGTNRLIDMESGGDLRVTLTPGLLRSYQRELAAFCERLAGTARRYRCFYRRIRSEEPATAFLREGMSSLIFTR